MTGVNKSVVLLSLAAAMPGFPRTREQKLAATGLTVNSPEAAKSIRRNDGIAAKFNGNNPNSRECQRRLRQLNRYKTKALAKLEKIDPTTLPA